MQTLQTGEKPETYRDSGFSGIFPVLQQQRLHHLLLGHYLQKEEINTKMMAFHLERYTAVFGEALTLAGRLKFINVKVLLPPSGGVDVQQISLQLPAHLAQGALHSSQEVVVAGPDAVCAVDVVDFKSQLLHLLKVVIQREHLGKDWVQVALDHFCPVQLEREHVQSDAQCFHVKHSHTPTVTGWRQAVCSFMRYSFRSLIYPCNIIFFFYIF